MEIQKNRYFRPFNLNRFALNAIASAILMLNAEVANAVSCPSQIVGNSLAGFICDFNNGSSVTVENGGIVGGINMASYNPPPQSHITIDTGGTVSNSTGIGIAISSSSLSNGLFNNGTISNTTGAGIVISNTSTINGGLSNNGLISTGNGSISINHSDINTGISNSGTIYSSNGTGILIANSSAINGGILNNGTIRGGGVDAGIAIINQSTINGDITNNSVIEASGSGNGIVMRSLSIINGGISNNGTIKSAVNSGIAILNQSQILGNISNNGTISGGSQGLSIHNASTVNGSIFNNGTINGDTGKGISIFSSTVISGSITNSGTIKGGSTGIAINSATIVSGGISNSGIIQGNSFAINTSSDSTVSQIDIMGQSARVIGDVQAINSTFNITSGALFTSEGSFNVNTFNIASNGIFNMANTIRVANAVMNAGTLAIGNTIQTIVGNYTQNTGGIFQTGISNTSHYGQLSVNGAIDLSESGNIAVEIGQNATFHQGDIFNIMTGNTVLAPISGFDVIDNSFFWEFVASTSNNAEVNLTAAINPDVYKVCQGAYCQGAANTIAGQIVTGNSAFSPYTLLATASEFKTAVSQATPELTNGNIQVTQLITQSVMDIVPMWSTLHGQSAGDAMIYQPGKIWFKPYGGSITQLENNTVEGFNVTAYGIVIGKDIPLREDWLFGGALSVGRDNIRGKSILDGQTIDSDDYQAMLYAAKKFPHHLYVAAQGLVGYGDNNTRRSIPLYASTSDGSYDSWFTNIRAQVGWSAYALNQDLVITPEIDASYLFISQGSYRESGSLMDLSVDSNNNSSLVVGVYGHAAYRLATLQSQQDMTLTGYAGVARDVLNSEPEITATFIAGGPSFSTFGVQFNEFVFRGGIGLTLAHPNKPLHVNLNYDLQSGNNAFSGVGTFTVMYKL